MGGAAKIIPPFQQTNLTPNIPNEQKQIYQEKMQNRPPPQQTRPTLSVEYYHPQPAKKQDPNAQISKMYQYTPFVAPSIAQPYNCFGMMYPGVQEVPPVIVKNYTIEAGGIAGDHSKMSMIYEDVMPHRKFSPSYTTLGERIDDYQFIRASILNNEDGNDIDLHRMTENSLNSKIKIDVADVNPFNSYKQSSNPYKGLPYGFLLYRSCYPIKQIEKSGNVGCSKNSTAINIRVYKMLEGSFYINKFDRNLLLEYDEWREVAFYEYIRENILKKQICPNFITMYGYFISLSAMIGYDKINTRDEPRDITMGLKPARVMNADLIIREGDSNYAGQVIPAQATFTQSGGGFPGIEQAVNGIREMQTQGVDYYSPDMKTMTNIRLAENGQPIFTTEQSQYQKMLEKRDKITVNQNGMQVIQKNPNAYSGKSMVVLTESPTQSVLQWATRTYQRMGNKNEMINTGYHRELEWQNVFFQLMVALHVMQIHGLSINNFSFARNVFIKDLPERGPQTDYWKYKIDGVDYYIPNIGFLVMVDSDFRDLNITRDVQFTQKERTHKLNATYFGDTTENENKINAFKMFKECFNRNIFGREFSKYGGVPPPPNVLNLLDKIAGEIAQDNKQLIGPYILRHMKTFIHNRVGTFLKDTEITHIRRDQLNFKKGQIVVLPVAHDQYKFVMYLETNDKNAKIVTKEKHTDKNYIETEISYSQLIGYVESDPIQQDRRGNEQNLMEENLLETYIVEK
jgi:hypothetical protein